MDHNFPVDNIGLDNGSEIFEVHINFWKFFPEISVSWLLYFSEIQLFSDIFISSISIQFIPEMLSECKAPEGPDLFSVASQSDLSEIHKLRTFKIERERGSDLKYHRLWDDNGVQVGTSFQRAQMLIFTNGRQWGTALRDDQNNRLRSRKGWACEDLLPPFF